MGKSGKSVRVVITHLAKEHIMSHEVQLIKEANEIKEKLIENLSYIFDFDCSVTNYFSPKKISHVIYFKELEIKQLKYSNLYSEFEDTVKKIFKGSDFKILHYRQISNTLHIAFEHIPSQNNLYPPHLRVYFRNNFYFSYFTNLKKKFLFNSNKLKEIISEKGLIYVYRIELLRKRYNFTDFGICKESKHLFIKYIKMLNSASKYLMRYHNWSNCSVYLELGTSTSRKHLRHLYHQINEESEFSPYIFLGRDKLKLSEGDLWIPRRRELDALFFDDELDRRNLILIRYSKYQQWRKKHKISIKCEELNLLAYYMETKYKRVWKFNGWGPKPSPPTKVFKINNYLTLKLVDDKTKIYVKGKVFTHCKYLLFSFTHEELSEYEEIDSIDEIKDKYDLSHEGHSKRIPPEVEFWGHCSNLQAWYEHDYDTRILHTNIAFPLLKELSKQGDPLAAKVFKDEIALRFESNFDSVIGFLLHEDYLSFLDLDEINALSENLDFMNWYYGNFLNFFEQWRSKASNLQEDEKVFQIQHQQHIISLKKKGIELLDGDYGKEEV